MKGSYTIADFLIRITATDVGLQKSLQGLPNMFNNLSAHVFRFGMSIQQLGGMFSKMGDTLYGAIGNILEEAAKLEKVVADVTAVMGDSSEKTKTAISTLILDTLRKVPFSMEEIGKGLRAMSQAGYETAADMAANLEIFLKFAKAADTTVEHAVVSLTAIQKGLGLFYDEVNAASMTAEERAAKNAKELERIAGIIALVANKTTASMAEVADAFTNKAAAAARLFGYSLEDLAAIIAVLAESGGAKGRLAGDRAYQLMRDLQNTAVKSVSLYHRQGVAMHKSIGAAAQMTDAYERQLKKIEELEKGTIKYSAAEEAAIKGQRDMQIKVDDTSNKLAELQMAMENLNAQSQNSATATNDFALKKMRLNNEIAITARRLIAYKNDLQQYNMIVPTTAALEEKRIEKIKELKEGLGDLEQKMNAFNAVATDVIAKEQLMGKVTAPLAKIIFDAEGKPRKIVDVIKDLTEALKDYTPEARRAALTAMGFQERSLNAIVPLIGKWEKMAAWQKDFAQSGEKLNEVYAAKIDNTVDKLKLLGNAFEFLKLKYGAPLLEALKPGIDAIGQFIDEIADAANGPFMEEWKAFMFEFSYHFGNSVREIIAMIKQWWAENGESVMTQIMFAMRDAPQTFTSIMKVIGSIAGALTSTGFAKLWLGLAAMGPVVGPILSMAGGFLIFLSGLLPFIIQGVTWIWRLVVGIFTTAMSITKGDRVQAFFMTIKELFVSLWRWLSLVVWPMLKPILVSAWASVSTWITETAWPWILGLLKLAVVKITALVVALFVAITANLEMLFTGDGTRNWFTDLLDWLAPWFMKFVAWAIEMGIAGLQWLGDKTIEYGYKAVMWLWNETKALGVSLYEGFMGMIYSMGDELKAMFMGLLPDWLQKAIDGRAAGTPQQIDVGPGAAFAGGGVMRNSGWAMVGERGREIVRLGAGSRVYNNKDTEAMIGGVNVSVGQLVVREDADVKRIADELYRRIQRSKSMNTGLYAMAR